MDVNQLREILRQEEGLKLDFKREYKLNRTPPPDPNSQMWTQLVNGQWHELIKDIIALTNGNVGVPNQVAYLIIGADDLLQPDGTRKTFDVSHLNIRTQQVIAKVNNVCEPPIPDISCEQFAIDGNLVYVISIPPSPYVHETNKQLTPISGNFDRMGNLIQLNPGRVYTEYTAFIRKGENVSPASANERRALETDKKFDLIIMDENLKFELINNLKIMLSKSKKDGWHSPGEWYRPFRLKHTITVDDDLVIQSKYITGLVLAILGTGPSKGMSTRFIEIAINSGRYLSYNSQTGRHERSEFLRYLHELYINISAFIRAAEHPKIIEFLPKYHQKGRRDDVNVRVENYDIIMVAAMLERFENVVTLSAALLAYIVGDKTSLVNIQLNKSSPIDAENDKLAAEIPTDEEIIDWVRSTR